MKRKPCVYFTTIINGNKKLNLGVQVNLNRTYGELIDEQFNDCVLNGYIWNAMSGHGDGSVIMTMKSRIDTIEQLPDGTKKYTYELVGKTLVVSDVRTLFSGLITAHANFRKMFDLSNNYTLQIQLPFGSQCRSDFRSYQILCKMTGSTGSTRIAFSDIK